MISFDSEIICLFELIKASLFDSHSPISDEANWERVIDLVKAQCIMPLVISHVPSEYKKECIELSNKSKAHYMQLLFEQDNLVKLFKANDIPLVIIKGTAAAIYFPSTSLRTFGDIDFFISDEHIENALLLLKENGYRFLSSDSRQYEFEKNGIEFELHSKFSCRHYNDIDHIILNGMNNIVDYKIGNYSFCGLPTYENGLVLLGHIMQHLKSSGIGLRQILDWMMFVHEELDDSAWYDHFQPLANEAGLEKLATTVTFMCKKWLGLPNDISWCKAADEDVADQLMLRIVDDGNFGHYRAPCEKVKKSFNEEGTFKYLQKSGMINWPLAQKCAFFRPFAWLYQLCRYGGKGISSLFTGKKVFIKSTQYLSLEELWKELE